MDFERVFVLERDLLGGTVMKLPRQELQLAVSWGYWQSVPKGLSEGERGKEVVVQQLAEKGQSLVLRDSRLLVAAETVSDSLRLLQRALGYWGDQLYPGVQMGVENKDCYLSNPLSSPAYELASNKGKRQSKGVKWEWAGEEGLYSRLR